MKVWFKNVFDTKLILAASLTALLMALAFPPAGLWPLGWIAMVIWGLIFKKSDSVRSKPGLFFFWFSFSVQLFGFYWIAYLFHEFGSSSWPISVVMLFGVLVIFSLSSAAWGWAFGFAHRKWFSKERYASSFWLLGLAWVLWDTFDLRFFPWTPVMSVGGWGVLLSSAGYLGTQGWRWVFFVSAAIIAQLLVDQRFTRRDRAMWLTTAFILTWTIPILLGIKNRRDLMKEFSNSQPVAILQGNIGNSFKKNAKLGEVPSIYKIASIYRDLVEESTIHFYSETTLLPGQRPIYFWPETSFPGDWNRADFLGMELRSWVERSKGLHLVGAYESGYIQFHGQRKEVDFNVLAAIEPGKVGESYQKMIRIPFGEYIPGDKWFPQAYSWLPSVNHFGAGESYKLLNTEGQGPVMLPLICYEILFESFANGFVAKARKEFPNRDIVLVNPSNDSWYGPTSQPFQNEFLARWAAARLRLPLVRPANTGISAVIAPWGEVLAKGHLDEPEVIYGEIPVR